MKFQTKYKIMLWKGYFDRGWSLLNYVKYILLAFGAYNMVTEGNIKLILVIALVYGFFCLILGRAYFKYGWVTAGHEVQNQFNLFVKEMRKKGKV